MTGFENNEVLQTGLCGGCDCIGFDAKLTYVVDATAKTAKVTDASTYGAGDGLLSINVHVSDKNGKQKHGHVGTDGTEATINIAELDLSSIDITATVVTEKGCKADLGIYKIGSVALTGSLLYKNNQ